MKSYNENAPLSTKDKRFLDDMVCSYLDLVLIEQNIQRAILALEAEDPTVFTHVSIEELYKVLEANELDKEQISEVVMEGKFNY